MDVETILNNMIAAFLGALIITVMLKLFEVFKKPHLDIVFNEKDTYKCAKADPKSPEELFVHLNVKNNRRSMAYGCKVFLLQLEEKINGAFTPIDIKVHYTLKWANENEPKGYEGLEIPGHYRRKVDLINGPKGGNVFYLFIEGGSRDIRNGFGNGEYRFTVQASGTNTTTVTKKFIVKWKGVFDKTTITVIEEKKGISGLFHKF